MSTIEKDFGDFESTAHTSINTDNENVKQYDRIVEADTRRERLNDENIVRSAKELLKKNHMWVKPKGMFFKHRTTSMLESVMENHLKGIPLPLETLRAVEQERYEDHADFTYYDIMMMTLDKNDPYFIAQGRKAGFNPNKTKHDFSPLATKIAGNDLASVMQLIKAGADVNADTNNPLSPSSDGNNACSMLRLSFEMNLENNDLSVTRALLAAGARDTPDSKMQNLGERLYEETLKRLDALKPHDISTPQERLQQVQEISQLNELLHTIRTYRGYNVKLTGNDKSSFDDFMEKVDAFKTRFDSEYQFYFLNQYFSQYKELCSLTDESHAESLSIQEFTRYIKLAQDEDKLYEDQLVELKRLQQKYDNIHVDYLAENALKTEQLKAYKKNFDIFNENLHDKMTKPQPMDVALSPVKNIKPFEQDGMQIDPYVFRHPYLKEDMQFILSAYYIGTDGYTNVKATSEKANNILELIEKYPEIVNLPLLPLDIKKSKDKALANKWNEGFDADGNKFTINGKEIAPFKRQEPLCISIMRSGNMKLIEGVINSQAVDFNLMSTRGDTAISVLIEHENWAALEYLLSSKKNIDTAILIPPANLTMVETLYKKAFEAPDDKERDMYLKAAKKFNEFMPQALRIDDIPNIAKFYSNDMKYGYEDDKQRLLDHREMHEKMITYINNSRNTAPVTYKFVLNDPVFKPDPGFTEREQYFSDVIQQLITLKSSGQVEDFNKLQQFMNNINDGKGNVQDYVNELTSRLIGLNRNAENQPILGATEHEKEMMYLIAIQLMDTHQKTMLDHLTHTVQENKGKLDIESLDYLANLNQLAYLVQSDDIFVKSNLMSQEQKDRFVKKLTDLRSDIDIRIGNSWDYESNISKGMDNNP